MPSRLSELAYTFHQGMRVAWYGGAYLAAKRMQKPVPLPRTLSPRRPQASSLVDMMLADIVTLFEHDLMCARAGDYPLPRDWFGQFGEEISRMRLLFADVREVDRRRTDNIADEPFQKHRGKRPRYYLQNFHFQSDGWMSDKSAAIYDVQVEVLFGGTAAAMRRQTIVPIAQYLKGRDQRRLRLLDLGCGTARWLKDLRPAFPALDVSLVDMSEPYLNRALSEQKGGGRLTALLAAAEALPLADASQDIVTAIFLFHELPPKIRRQVTSEIARVLKPGGIFVLTDSLQRGDHPPYDRVLELFPHGFHEPYFAGYLETDLNALFGAAGLSPHSRHRAFLSTIATFQKG